MQLTDKKRKVGIFILKKFEKVWIWGKITGVNYCFSRFDNLLKVVKSYRQTIRPRFFLKPWRSYTNWIFNHNQVFAIHQLFESSKTHIPKLFPIQNKPL